MFEIEKNIPVGDLAENSQGRPPKYPFKSMSVGDSFFVPDGMLNQHCKPYNAMNAQNSKRKISPSSPLFKAAKEDSGIRIWRIE